jgi:hypothetical protein
MQSLGGTKAAYLLQEQDYGCAHLPLPGYERFGEVAVDGVSALAEIERIPNTGQ